MPKPCLYCLILISLLAIRSSFAQTLQTDTAPYRPVQTNIIQLYIDSVKENLRFYRGTEFTAAYRSSAGHPFFEFAEPQTGEINDDGTNYPVMQTFAKTKRIVVMEYNVRSNSTAMGRNVSL